MVYLSIVFMSGMSTLLVYTESVMASVLDILYENGISCKGLRRWMVQLGLCVVEFLFGILFTTKVCVIYLYERFTVSIKNKMFSCLHSSEGPLELLLTSKKNIVSQTFS